jgi:hypothetical protein
MEYSFTIDDFRQLNKIEFEPVVMEAGERIRRRLMELIGILQKECKKCPFKIEISLGIFAYQATKDGLLISYDKSGECIELFDMKAPIWCDWEIDQNSILLKIKFPSTVKISQETLEELEKTKFL